MYKTANDYYKERFGTKVYKLSVDVGFTCPNRDGTVGNTGCIFCSERGSGEFAECGGDLLSMLENAKKRVSAKNKDGKYLAYFQAFTNTYAPIDRLQRLYSTAIQPDYIVGLAVATRPDCLSEEVVRLLAEINKQKPVIVELGLQTINEKTVDYIRRGYKNEVYFSAVSRLHQAGIDVVTHIIIGLPNETEADAVSTTRAAIRAGTSGVKFHMLYVVKTADIYADYQRGAFQCLSLEEYGKILSACIKELPPSVAVHRITGDAVKSELVAPLWSADKKRVLNYLNKYLSKEQDHGN